MQSRKIIAALAATVVVAAGLAAADTATTKKTAPAARKATTTTRKGTPSARKTPTTKKGVTSSSSKKRRTGATGSRTAQATWRTRQTQPSPDRYKQIQQALVSKGYLHGEPTGTWNQESIDALRKFQTDQKLESTGKIDSLSLIALGLGPKHETAAAQPPQATTPATN